MITSSSLPSSHNFQLRNWEVVKQVIQSQDKF
jgi:hypothetical protein